MHADDSVIFGTKTHGYCGGFGTTSGKELADGKVAGERWEEGRKEFGVSDGAVVEQC